MLSSVEEAFPRREVHASNQVWGLEKSERSLDFNPTYVFADKTNSLGDFITRAALSTCGRAKTKFLSLPALEAATVTESGKPAAQAEGVKFLRMEIHAAVYAIGSGTYRFQSTLP